MTFWTLIRRSLRFHARAHLGVVLGAAIGSAALVGALVVGDSVRESLRERALEGLGKIETALSLSDRFVTEKLAGRMTGHPLAADQPKPASLLNLPSLAARADGEAR